jgi:CO/xanthine dehydrogenase Mo-binding subunit
LRATDAPQIEILFVKPKNPSPLACGAKGVGELATIPVTPAISGAYYDRDKEFRGKLPLEKTFYRKGKQ